MERQRTMSEIYQIKHLEERALKVLALLDDEVIDFDMLHYNPLFQGSQKVVMTIYPTSCAEIISEVFDILREYQYLKNHVTKPELKGDKDVCKQDSCLETQEPRQP